MARTPYRLLSPHRLMVAARSVGGCPSAMAVLRLAAARTAAGTARSVPGDSVAEILASATERPAMGSPRSCPRATG